MLARIARRFGRRANRARWGEADRLHLGCGDNRIPGWLNIGRPGDIEHDLRKPLPIPDGSIRYIFSEHFVEHLNPAELRALLGECRRVLAAGGVLRISTPDLRALAEEYLAGRTDAYTDRYWRPATPCRMLNEALRLWGHQFVYDFEELAALLGECGFAVERVARHESAFPDLRNLEFREPHRDLIVEARSPATPRPAARG